MAYIRIILGVSVAALLCLWYPNVSPSASQVVITHHGLTENAELPYRTTSSIQTRYALTFQFFHGTFSPTHYNLWADDCLEHLVVNGSSVPLQPLPLCDWGKSFEFDLSPVLRPGMNEFTVVFSNPPGSGGFSVAPAFFDRWVLSFRIVATLFVLCLMWIATPSLARYPLTRASLLLGVALRLLYFYATPPRVRAHDFDGHLEFIGFISTHLQIPPASQGWEFHQPPLYYLITGGLARLLLDAGCSSSEVLHALELISLVCTLGTLFVAIKIGQLLFSERRDELALFLYSLIISTLPSLVYSSTRVSNDVLFHLCAFTWMLAILYWWHTPNTRTWLCVLTLIILTCLSKATAAPLVAATLVLALLRPRTPRSHRVVAFASAFLTAVLTIGSLWLHRSSIEGSPSLFDKGQTLHSALRVGNTLENFVHFDVRQILLSPFNNPWSDAAGRQYFWEYFFRSMYFGEFQYRPELVGLASWILGCGLLWMAMALCGVCSTLISKQPSLIPLGVTGLALLASVLGFRVWYPFAVHQDFRFVHLLAVPLAALPGMCRPQSRSVRYTVAVMASIEATLQIIFLLLLLDTQAPL